MYKVEIKIGDWDFMDDEILTIETSNFEKVQIIQEFIEFQKEYGWAVDYDVTDEFIANQFDDAGTEFGEDENEDEEYVYDEETDAWYWLDEEADVWYVYDEESDDWIEYVEDEESEDEAEEQSDNTTHFVITRIEA
jgi:hypothetical protein